MSKCSLFVNNKYQDFALENKEALGEIMEDIKKMHKNANSPEGFSKSVKKYLREINEDKIKADADEVLNVIKSESNLNRVMDMRSKGVPTSEALRSFLTPSTFNAENASVSIAPIMSKSTIKYTNMIEQATTSAEKKILAKGSLDEEIILDMAGGTTKRLPDGSVKNIEINPTSKKMSGIFRKILDMTHSDKTNVGIMLNKINDYVFNQSMLQDSVKMRNLGEDAWIDMQLKDLDHEKSFPYMNTDAEKRDYLKKVYEGALERSDDAAVTNWEVLKEKDILKSSVQAKYAKPRTLHYTPEGLVNQFKTFSDKPLVEIMIAEISKSARDTAIYDVLGPRGTNALDTVVQKVSRQIQKEINAATDPKVKIKLEAELDEVQKSKSTLLRDMNQINNSNSKVKNRNVKAAFDAGRTFTNTLILGKVPLAAVTDLAWGVTAQQINTDRGYLHGMGKMAKSIIETVPPERRASLVTKMKIAQESALGHMLRVEGAETFLEKVSTKLNYAYSTVLPVQWQTRLHRTWSANVLGHDIGEMAGKNWDQLNELQAKSFQKAGIKPEDWPAIQAMREKMPEGYEGHMVSSDDVIKIDDELAKQIIANHRAKDPLFTIKKPAEYKAYLERRMDAYIEDYMTTAVPMPGERARGLLHGNGEAGDVGHEIRKTLTMLKSFMVHQAALSQKVMRASPHKADKARHLSGMVIGLVGMAYGRNVIENLMEGEDLPDPTNMEVVKKAVLRSGVGSVLADVALGDSYGGQETSIKALVGGPVVAKLDEAVGLAKKAYDGGLSSKDNKKLAKFIPGNNLMYLKLMNHHILDDAKAAMDLD